MLLHTPHETHVRTFSSIANFSPEPTPDKQTIQSTRDLTSFTVMLCWLSPMPTVSNHDLIGVIMESTKPAIMIIIINILVNRYCLLASICL
ncbi:hypothetical protein HanXRQr2_Chr15g0722391 [Helianthus annuus]|uniref:Uncharacterized protein n=1 Tax=Helianthus annuus TaxID=4232 RepID=A0A9K3E601_HELAN|nr:hypothetical protein HanXRQr2_Chr15g0722391 [Helianthus annuus]